MFPRISSSTVFVIEGMRFVLMMSATMRQRVGLSSTCDACAQAGLGTEKVTAASYRTSRLRDGVQDCAGDKLPFGQVGQELP